MIAIEPKERSEAADGADASSEPRGLIAWFAKNHVAANLLMVMLLVGGAWTALQTQVEIFPDIDPRTVTVTVPYPGATPNEIEEGICRRVEEAVAGIEGIERVRSVSREGSGTVTVELREDANDREVLDDVKSAVEGLQDFPPQDAEDFRIADTTVQRAVITIALYGDASERTLRELAFRLRDELTSLDGLSVANVQGVRDYEIAIEVRERDLRERGLTFEEVARAVSGFSVNLPGGSIRTDGGEILLRTSNQAYSGLDFEELVVRTAPDGTLIRLRDVADVRDGFEDVDRHATFNGMPAAFVDVKRVGDQGALDVEGIVQRYVADLALPEGVQATTWGNRANILRSRIDLLVRNGLMGLVLVFGVLVMFLDLRLAFWTTMGIPISFLGAFLFIPSLGGSINMISLFAFILVLGIVVDDAIVVGENIFAKHQEGLSGTRAAVEGLREVMAPVTIGVLTTVIAFLPLYFTEGFFGDILWVVPVVVVGVLLMSLVEAIFILPAHLSSPRRVGRHGALPILQGALRDGLSWLVERTYRPVLRLSLRYRYVTIATGVAIFAIVGGLVAGGHVRFVLFPAIDADDISVRASLVGGTPAAETERVLEHLVACAEQVRAEFDEQSTDGETSVFRNLAASLGSQPFGGGGGPEAGPGEQNSNVCEVAIELQDGEERTVSAAAMVKRWRELVGDVPGATAIDFTSTLLSAGDDVSVELAHADFEQLLVATERLKRHLAEFNGLSEISDSFEPGKRELNFALRPAGVASGLTLADLARQVRQAYYGFEAQRVQRGRDDIKVLVRYSEKERRSLQSLDELRIRLPSGGEVPFHTVARFDEGRGYATIDRTDRRRIVRVTADADEEVANAGDINAGLKEEFLPELAREIPGLAFSFEGAERERMDSVQSLLSALVIAVIGIFALIAAQLKSYTQPLIIVSVVPFGVIGAVLGHVLLGYDLSFFSMFGVVALAGVVVNDSLVLLDMVNRLQRKGATALEAVLEAGPRRFRPILFTTLTTCAGLAPMLFEKSLQAQFLIPMAISLASGVAFATVITLVLVPVLVLIREDIAGLGRRAASAMTG